VLLVSRIHQVSTNGIVNSSLCDTNVGSLADSFGVLAVCIFQGEVVLGCSCSHWDRVPFFTCISGMCKLYDRMAIWGGCKNSAGPERGRRNFMIYFLIIVNVLYAQRRPLPTTLVQQMLMLATGDKLFKFNV
jgi:hypothetical protein